MKKQIKELISSIDFDFKPILNRVESLEYVLEQQAKELQKYKEEARLEKWKKERLIQRRTLELRSEENEGYVHSFVIGNTSLGTGYLMVTLFEDGSVADLKLKMKNDVSETKIDFISIDPEDFAKVIHRQQQDYSELFIAFHSLLTLFFRCISIGLQHSVPISIFIKEFKYCRFFPDGFSRNQDIPMCTSIIDYLMKYIEKKQ